MPSSAKVKQYQPSKRQVLSSGTGNPTSKLLSIVFLSPKKRSHRDWNVKDCELAWKRFESHLQKLETDAAYAEKVKQIRQPLWRIKNPAKLILPENNMNIAAPPN